MSSDDIKRPKDTAFRYAGEGLPIWTLCFFFHQRKERSGGKMRGPLRNLFSCKACEEKRK